MSQDGNEYFCNSLNNKKSLGFFGAKTGEILHDSDFFGLTAYGLPLTGVWV